MTAGGAGARKRWSGSLWRGSAGAAAYGADGSAAGNNRTRGGSLRRE
ncbi:MAG: hypothetical protein LBL83_11330 [Clostridiales bacterium]|nr:hypothetical protein [Clostridiales bacterium]